MVWFQEAQLSKYINSQEEVKHCYHPRDHLYHQKTFIKYLTVHNAELDGEQRIRWTGFLVSYEASGHTREWIKGQAKRWNTEWNKLPGGHFRGDMGRENGMWTEETPKDNWELLSLTWADTGRATRQPQKPEGGTVLGKRSEVLLACWGGGVWRKAGDRGTSSALVAESQL